MAFFSLTSRSTSQSFTFTAPPLPTTPPVTEAHDSGSSTSGDGSFSVTVNGQPAANAPLIGHALLFPAFHF